VRGNGTVILRAAVGKHPGVETLPQPGLTRTWQRFRIHGPY
jgi:hypothetical protein